MFKGVVLNFFQRRILKATPFIIMQNNLSLFLDIVLNSNFLSGYRIILYSGQSSRMSLQNLSKVEHLKKHAQKGSHSKKGAVPPRRSYGCNDEVLPP